MNDRREYRRVIARSMDDGATATEYALMISAIVVVLVAVIGYLGDSLATQIANMTLFLFG